MQQITYRGNLSSTEFPLMSENQGRTVIIPGPDNYYAPVVGAVDLNKRGIPQIMYGHNIMPTASGFQSIAYIPRIPAPPIDVSFTHIYIIYNGNAAGPTYIAHDSVTNQFWASAGNVNIVDWVLLDTPAVGERPTFGAVNGKTYMCLRDPNAYYWDPISNLFVAVTFTALANTRGIVAASGYLISWYQNILAWSSLVDPTDFTPSLVTGAGGGAVQEAKGDILFCKAINSGFIIFCERNILSATYSGNSRYPFIFKEILGGGGFIRNELNPADADYVYDDFITVGDSGNKLYAFTNSGLLAITLNEVASIYPEVTDFIEDTRVEDYNEDTLKFEVFTRTKVSPVNDSFYPTGRKLTLIGNRWIILSYNANTELFQYGASSFTHALVFDTALQKWGKLKVPHTFCFDYIPNAALPNEYSMEDPRDNIAFLKLDGSVSSLDFNTLNPDSSGVLILGKFQYQRSTLLNLQQVCIENVQNQNNCKVYDYPTLNGFDLLDPIEENFQFESYTSRQRLSNFRAPGLNHSIAIIGGFSINSIILTFFASGRR